ncbi:MAG: hypothetical protein PCFJNLEI_03290 [Verrucomicrobiae bacterium]|nr:hypothetical protein [Verrucomicrobiae bacterium]
MQKRGPPNQALPTGQADKTPNVLRRKQWGMPPAIEPGMMLAMFLWMGVVFCLAAARPAPKRIPENDPRAEIHQAGISRNHSAARH